MSPVPGLERRLGKGMTVVRGSAQIAESISGSGTAEAVSLRPSNSTHMPVSCSRASGLPEVGRSWSWRGRTRSGYSGRLDRALQQRRLDRFQVTFPLIGTKQKNTRRGHVERAQTGFRRGCLGCSADTKHPESRLLVNSTWSRPPKFRQDGEQIR